MILTLCNNYAREMVDGWPNKAFLSCSTREVQIPIPSCRRHSQCGGDTVSSPPGRRQKPHARGSQTGRGSDAAALKKFGLLPRRQPNILPSAGVSAALVRFIFCRKLAICRPSSILGAFFVGGVYPNLFCATVVPNPPGS